MVEVSRTEFWLPVGPILVVGPASLGIGGRVLLIATIGMLTVTFFGCFSAVFQFVFQLVFTANSNFFAAKTDEKRNEKQMKNR
jgi:hypothetical protein